MGKYFMCATKDFVECYIAIPVLTILYDLKLILEMVTCLQPPEANATIACPVLVLGFYINMQYMHTYAGCIYILALSPAP